MGATALQAFPIANYVVKVCTNIVLQMFHWNMEQSCSSVKSQAIFSNFLAREMDIVTLEIYTTSQSLSSHIKVENKYTSILPIQKFSERFKPCPHLWRFRLHFNGAEQAVWKASNILQRQLKKD